MLRDLSLLFLLGLVGSHIFERLNLPGLLAIILSGMVLGPNFLNVLGSSSLEFLQEFKILALIILLLRAGLGIELGLLRKVGWASLKLSFIPGLVEGFFIILAAVILLDFSFIQGGILGFMLAAVSPAVVVPFMIDFMDKGLGQDKGIPLMILSGASIDDVFAITIFTTFLGAYKDRSIGIGRQLVNIPLSIVKGIILGLILGFFLLYILKKLRLGKGETVLLVLGLASIFNYMEAFINMKSLIGVMALGFVIANRDRKIAKDLSEALNYAWLPGQIIIFGLIGASVDLSLTRDYLLVGSLIILLGLVARSLGVLIALRGTDLNKKEKLFSIISYLPKATVQASLGSIPLAEAVQGGEIILALAVLSIVLTAPLGAILIKKTAPKLLKDS